MNFTRYSPPSCTSIFQLLSFVWHIMKIFSISVLIRRGCNFIQYYFDEIYRLIRNGCNNLHYFDHITLSLRITSPQKLVNGSKWSRKPLFLIYFSFSIEIHYQKTWFLFLGDSHVIKFKGNNDIVTTYKWFSRTLKRWFSKNFK